MGSVHAETALREMKTIHFDIFFPEGMEKTAAYTGSAAEKAYAEIADKLNHEMSVPVPVFLSDENCAVGTDLFRTSHKFMNRCICTGTGQNENLSVQLALCFLYDRCRQQGYGPLSVGSIPENELKADAEKAAEKTGRETEPFFDFRQTVFTDYDPWQNMFLSGSAGLHLMSDRENACNFSLMADDILGMEKMKFSGALTGDEFNLNPYFLLSWKHGTGKADVSLSAFIISSPVFPEAEKFQPSLYETSYGTEDTEEQGGTVSVSVPGKIFSMHVEGGLSRCSSPGEAAAGLLKLRTSGEINHIFSGKSTETGISFRASAGLIKFLNVDSPLYSGELSFLWNLRIPDCGRLALKGFAGAETGRCMDRMPLFFNMFNGVPGSGISGIYGRKLLLAGPEYSYEIKSADFFRFRCPFTCEISLKGNFALFTSDSGSDKWTEWGAGLKFVFFPSLILKLDALVPVQGKSKNECTFSFSAACYLQQG